MEGREAQYSLAAAPVGGGRARLQCPWAVAGPGRASRRRATTSVHQAPPVWRAPEGPEGTGVPVGGGGARPRYRWAVAGSGCGARGWRRGQAAVPVGGGRARPRCRWVAAGPGRGAGGRRQGQGGPRDRPLRAVRLACGDLAGGPPPTGTHSGPAPQPGPAGAPNTSGAPSNTTTGTTPTRPGIQKTDIRIGCRPVVELGGFEPPTFSLRTRRATNCAIAPRTRTA